MDYAETLRRSPVFRNSFEPTPPVQSGSKISSTDSVSPVEIHLKPARHELQHFNLDTTTSHQSSFDHFDTTDSKLPDDLPVLCEKQVTIIVLLARVCTVYDATPKTFVTNVLRLHRLGIIDSISFLSDLGLLPTSPLTSPHHGDFIDQWDMEMKNFTPFPQTLNMSRYARDFEELSLLGQGGFGHVYQARHKLDGNIYAIKQVRFLNKGYQSPLVQNVLREVHCLARCDHPNVNRYYGAWLEPTWIPMTSNLNDLTPPSTHHSSVSLSSIETKLENRQLLNDIRRFVDIKSDNDDNDDEISILSISEKSYLSYNENESLFQFEYSKNQDIFSMQSNFSDLPSYHPEPIKSHDETHDQTQLKIVPRGNPSIQDVSNWALKRKLKLYDKVLPRIELGGIHDGGSNFTYQITLYIQMYLCEKNTLHDWIEKRNNLIPLKINFEMNLNLFRQLVDGLYHVHQNGIIHRDLKPSNIFMTCDGSLKIGDFGLSKLLAQVMEEDSSVLYHTENEHTQGVGTISYASPEQVSGNQYDYKVDSFSLGIILLELFQPFQTKMERAKALKNVRNEPCELPLKLIEKYPEIAHIIQGLTAPTSIRWTMEETKNYLNEIFPKVQLEKASEVLELREKLKEKQNRLIEQDAIIQDLRQQLEKLSK